MSNYSEYPSPTGQRLTVEDKTATNHTTFLFCAYLSANGLKHKQIAYDLLEKFLRKHVFR